MTIDLDALEKLAAEATRAPWKKCTYPEHENFTTIERAEGMRGQIARMTWPMTRPDAELIVFLRNNATDIAAELRSLRPRLATVEADAYNRAAIEADKWLRRDGFEQVAAVVAERIRALGKSGGTAP